MAKIIDQPQILIALEIVHHAHNGLNISSFLHIVQYHWPCVHDNLIPLRRRVGLTHKSRQRRMWYLEGRGKAAGEGVHYKR